MITDCYDDDFASDIRENSGNYTCWFRKIIERVSLHLT